MTLTLLSDLYDVSNRLVLKKDAVANFEVLHKIMEHGKRLKKVYIRFGDTPLSKDFKNIFNEEKYFTIFTPIRTNEEIITVVNNIKITTEILEELKNIRDTLPYTFRHTLLVTALTVKIALDLKSTEYDPELIAVVGLTHDIGKTRVPKYILGKDSPLRQSEYNLLMTHSLISYILLCYYLGGSSNEILNAVRDHHEKLDGKGYPRGIKKIGKYAKIITPVDIFDALISERPYRSSPFTIRQALDYLIDEANADRVDKEAVYYLISYVRKEHPNPEELKPYEKRTSLSRADSYYGKVVPD